MHRLVIRTPRPEGAIDIAATFDADLAMRRRRAREAAEARTWPARFRRLLRWMRRPTYTVTPLTAAEYMARRASRGA